MYPVQMFLLQDKARRKSLLRRGYLLLVAAEGMTLRQPMG